MSTANPETTSAAERLLAIVVVGGVVQLVAWFAIACVCLMRYALGYSTLDEVLFFGVGGPLWAVLVYWLSKFAR